MISLYIQCGFTVYRKLSAVFKLSTTTYNDTMYADSNMRFKWGRVWNRYIKQMHDTVCRRKTLNRSECNPFLFLWISDVWPFAFYMYLTFAPKHLKEIVSLSVDPIARAPVSPTHSTDLHSYNRCLITSTY